MNWSFILCGDDDEDYTDPGPPPAERGFDKEAPWGRCGACGRPLDQDGECHWPDCEEQSA